jgi:protein phosphatase
VRERNEDSFLVVNIPGRPGVLLAVADGLGGHEAGEVASRMTITALLREMPPGLRTADQARSWLDRCLAGANREIFTLNESLEGRQQMGTTVTAAVLVAGRAVIRHTGDSRLYRLRDGGCLEQVTDDETLVEALVRRGVLSREHAKDHPQGHVLCNCLGTRPEAALLAYAFRSRPGDRYLICSDGVSGSLRDPEIEACLRRAGAPRAAVAELIRLSLARGGRDNLSAVVAFCG